MSAAQPLRPVKTIIIGSLVALDMVMAHYLSGQSEVQAWAVVLAILPLVVVGLSLIRGVAGNGVCCLVLALVVAALIVLLPVLEHHVRWVYFIQNITANLLLGTWFGLSLLRGRESLCTTFAGLLHPVMHPLLIRYTTHLTQFWTAFFFGMATISIALFFLASPTVWSVFANLLTLPLVGLAFAIEYVVRIRILPPEDHMGLTSAFRAYRALMRRPSSASTTNDG